jgi:hypothetical protein
MKYIILGMHRSGTSMVTGLVKMMGAYLGPESEMMPPTLENPKGYFERWDVMRLNDRLLAEQGCSWDDVAGWIAPEDPAVLDEDLLDGMRRLIADLDAHGPSALKDPRLCLTFPFWKPLLGGPVPIVVHRNPREVALSLGRRGYSLPFGLALWEAYAVHLLNASQHIQRVFARFDDVIGDPVAAVTKLYKQLSGLDVQGLRLPEAGDIVAFVDPAYYRSRTGDTLEVPTLTPHQREVERILRGEAEQTGSLVLSEDSLTRLRGPSRTGG